MNMQSYISDIKLKLGGGLLDLELTDAQFESIVNSAFREIQRYINTTKLITLDVPRDKNVINFSDFKVSSVVAVYRVVSNEMGNTNMADPVYASQLQILSGAGGAYNIQDWTYNYAAWNTLGQIKNTMSTDLMFRYDKSNENLYINFNSGKPNKVTIEYIPRYDDVSEVVSDYWIDKLLNLSLALAKVTIGRIRSRYTQSNAQWSHDGEILLEEGNTELTNIREQLVNNSDIFLPID